MNDVTFAFRLSQRWGGMRPRCSTGRGLTVSQIGSEVEKLTSVQFTTQRCRKARGLVRFLIHGCLDEIVVLYHEGNLGVAVSLRGFSDSQSVRALKKPPSGCDH